jgi:threonine dehydrogenase-like Zn-dependent dehydrogenase
MSTSSDIRRMMNPSIVLYGAKNAKVEDKPVPELLDPHDVLVRIAYVGVCGSDVSIPLLLSPILISDICSRSISGTMAA